MNAASPTKSCPACGADLSTRTATMPGVCPACGRDLKLEAIVASLPRTETEAKRNGRPLGVMECGVVAFGMALFLGCAGALMVPNNVELPVLVAMFLGAPHFFLGFFTAGFFSRTVKAQLVWGFLLSLLFASLALIFVGCITMKF